MTIVPAFVPRKSVHGRILRKHCVENMFYTHRDTPPTYTQESICTAGRLCSITPVSYIIYSLSIHRHTFEAHSVKNNVYTRAGLTRIFIFLNQSLPVRDRVSEPLLYYSVCGRPTETLAYIIRVMIYEYTYIIYAQYTVYQQRYRRLGFSAIAVNDYHVQF